MDGEDVEDVDVKHVRACFTTGNDRFDGNDEGMIYEFPKGIMTDH